MVGLYGIRLLKTEAEAVIKNVQSHWCQPVILCLSCCHNANAVELGLTNCWHLYWSVKAKFHYAIQLASWSQTSMRASSRAG